MLPYINSHKLFSKPKFKTKENQVNMTNIESNTKSLPSNAIIEKYSYQTSILTEVKEVATLLNFAFLFLSVTGGT